MEYNLTAELYRGHSLSLPTLGTSLFFECDMNHDQAFLDALKALTLEDVNRVADKYLSAENAISIIVR